MGFVFDTKEYLDHVTALIREGKDSVPVTVAGCSMCPFLHEGDTVYLSPIKRELRRGDVILFTRRDGSYVLHRVTRVTGDGAYMTLGDNQVTEEPVRAEATVAICTSAVRRGRRVTPKSAVWRFYASVWTAFPQLRRLVGRIKNTAR